MFHLQCKTTIKKHYFLITFGRMRIAKGQLLFS